MQSTKIVFDCSQRFLRCDSANVFFFQPLLGSMKQNRVDTCIIGGGLAGLYIANADICKSGKLVVLETSSSCGGRIRSVYDDSKSNLLYESGPWRIPSSHHRVLELFRKFDIKLAHLRTPTVHQAKQESKRGLSIWESNAIHKQNPHEADRQDLGTGYAGETSAAAGTTPYITGADKYYVAVRGFSAIVDALVKRVRGSILTDAGVYDVQRKHKSYLVKYLSRKDGKITRRELITSTLFVCVPPSSCKTWQIFTQFARAQMAAVQSSCLNHIYVNAPNMTGFHQKSPSSLLGQSIGDQYDTDFFQASYSSGRLARMWYNLRLSQPVQYIRLLGQQLFSELGVVFPALASKVRSHFWEVAFHMWLPTPKFDVNRLVRLCVTPNRAHLPFVYVAGEAFSSHQAWMEGALETAELAIRSYENDREGESHVNDDDVFSKRSVTKLDTLVVEGRVCDVTAWKHVHPGTITAIENHMGEDVTDLFALINHSQNAWAQVLSLQVGWAK